LAGVRIEPADGLTKFGAAGFVLEFLAARSSLKHDTFSTPDEIRT
jgi:hypothetical protein